MPTLIRRLSTRSLLVCALTGVHTPTATAWWDLGHATVCEHSLTMMSPTTRNKIDELLALSNEARHIEAERFGVACSWPDRIKKQRPEASPWHYVNAPPGTLHIETRQRSSHGDVLSALERFSAQLADKDEPAIARAEALRWVGHLVADLHQPMHVGYARDWGGNKYRLKLPNALRRAIGEETRDTINMHALWDGYLLIYATRVEGAPLAQLVDRHVKQHTAGDPGPDDVIGWANESLGLLNHPDVRYVGSRMATLEESYLKKQYPAAIGRLASAAQRLARLLEQLLGD